MLSLSCKYAIRAAVYLMSRFSDTYRAGIKEIAGAIKANEHTTGKILQILVKEGIISSVKGPNGGFFMPEHKKPVHIIDIIRVIDGEDFFFSCGLGLAKCSESKPCPIHFTFKAYHEKMYEEFSTITIEKLADSINEGKAFLKG